MREDSRKGNENQFGETKDFIFANIKGIRKRKALKRTNVLRGASEELEFEFKLVLLRLGPEPLLSNGIHNNSTLVLDFTKISLFFADQVAKLGHRLRRKKMREEPLGPGES